MNFCGIELNYAEEDIISYVATPCLNVRSSLISTRSHVELNSDAIFDRTMLFNTIVCFLVVLS